MSTPNKDEVEGKWEQAKGYVKDKTGEVTNDPELEAEGAAYALVTLRTRGACALSDLSRENPKTPPVTLKKPGAK